MYTQICSSLQRMNRWGTVPHLPYSGGKSRQGTPVRKIQKTGIDKQTIILGNAAPIALSAPANMVL